MRIICFKIDDRQKWEATRQRLYRSGLKFKSLFPFFLTPASDRDLMEAGVTGERVTPSEFLSYQFKEEA